MAKLFAIYPQPATASPQGQATAADLANFASAGVDVMMGETRLI